MNDANLKVLAKIIIAVETGGQKYGNGRYNDLTLPYTNSSKEYTITLGAGGFYGDEGETLVQMIYDADVSAFRKLDVCEPSIESMLKKNWHSIKWNPSQNQRSVLVKIIDTQLGHIMQDELMAKKVQTMVVECEKLYPSTDIKAQMMYAEIRHLGGLSAVKRIFDRISGEYSLDNIMASLVKDQQSENKNLVGSQKYWSRHLKCRQFIDEYSVSEVKEVQEKPMTETQAAQKVLNIALDEVGYHEKASENGLYDKTANSGNNNYTKYNYEMHKLYSKVMDYPAAWCDCFVDWCMYKAFGESLAKKVLCGDFDDYTPSSANLYKKANRWTTYAKKGYQIFFKNSQRICHTELVYYVGNNKVYTVGGNSNNEVQKKSYSLDDPSIAGYGMPLYSAVVKADSENVKPSTPVTPAPEKPVAKSGVAGFQTWLNTYYPDFCKKYTGALLVVDNNYGPKTRRVAISVWKYMVNKYYHTNLTLGNFNFFEGSKIAAANVTLEEVKKHSTFAVILQGILAARKFYTGYIDGVVGSMTIEALIEFKRINQIGSDSVITSTVWYKLFN